jgi:hypothetical protein
LKETTRQAIIDLKRVKEQNELTCQEIYDLCEKNGEAVGLTTIRRIFAAGSEDKTNNFRPDTLNAILHAVIGTGNDALSKAENDALKAVIEMNDKLLAEKDEAINKLTRELEDTRLRLEATTDMFRLAMESLGKSSAQR